MALKGVPQVRYVLRVLVHLAPTFGAVVHEVEDVGLNAVHLRLGGLGLQPCSEGCECRASRWAYDTEVRGQLLHCPLSVASSRLLCLRLGSRNRGCRGRRVATTLLGDPREESVQLVPRLEVSDLREVVEHIAAGTYEDDPVGVALKG